MDALQLTAAFGSPPPDLKGKAYAEWHEPRKIIEHLHARRADIDANPELTDQGKARHLSRAVRDAEDALAKVSAKAAEYTDAASVALDRYQPRQVAEAMVAGIWDRLPDDADAVAQAYRDALQRHDWATCAAIDAMPQSFASRPDEATMAQLQRSRMAYEAPDLYREYEVVSTKAEAVGQTVRTANEFLTEIVRGLPALADGAEATLGEDGLRTVSWSQVGAGVVI